MTEPAFIPNHIYRRSWLHEQFKGQERGGISTPANRPFIFIFSGESGSKYGYDDRWDNDNVFAYTGEGQVGDMKFNRGNLILSKHLEKGKKVFLFQYVGSGIVKYVTELELIEIDFFEGVDKNNDKRVSIRYFLKRVGADLKYTKQNFVLTVPTKEQLEEIVFPTVTERKGLVTSRVGQGAYRKSILFRWDFKCAVTKYSNSNILIASHILPWRDSTNQERLDVDNGILLSPVYDALFDQHFISFDNKGKIILSDSLLDSRYIDLGVTGKESINNLNSGNLKYLDTHRERLIRRS